MNKLSKLEITITVVAVVMAVVIIPIVSYNVGKRDGIKFGREQMREFQQESSAFESCGKLAKIYSENFKMSDGHSDNTYESICEEINKTSHQHLKEEQ